MSKIAFQSQEDGTGTFTIAAPVGNTNRTLTIPDSSGTLITTAGAAMSGPLSNFTSTGIVDNATATSLTIDSAGRVLMPYQPSFAAYGTSSGSSYSTTVITFDLVDYNQGNHYNNTSYRFTAPVTGVYFFSISFLQYPTGSSSHVTVWVSKNGAAYTGNGSLPMSRATLPQQTTIGCDGLVYLNAGDYVEPKVEGSGSYYLASGHSHFSGHFVG